MTECATYNALDGGRRRRPLLCECRVVTNTVPTLSTHCDPMLFTMFTNIGIYCCHNIITMSWDNIR